MFPAPFTVSVSDDPEVLPHHDQIDRRWAVQPDGHVHEALVLPVSAQWDSRRGVDVAHRRPLPKDDLQERSIRDCGASIFARLLHLHCGCLLTGQELYEPCHARIIEISCENPVVENPDAGLRGATDYRRGRPVPARSGRSSRPDDSTN